MYQKGSEWAMEKQRTGDATGRSYPLIPKGIPKGTEGIDPATLTG
jgi:hypothetical protein